ncbi:MAG: hypothetical protein ABI036_08595 [Fibrobacteria bacterium]
MLSLHLTGNPWFLLLIPPGLWILWRQYGAAPGPNPGGRPRSANILFALQALALILLAVSLTAPEIRRHRIAFHPPTVLILRDQSSSFRAGGYLGAGAGYREFETSLVREYTARKFDVRVIDFAEKAWPVSGFAGHGHAADDPSRSEPSAPSSEGEASLTSLAAAADFVDSVSIPNLQGVFLFSDGRSNIDSGRGTPGWKVPLYPVIIPSDSIAEVQPEEARLSMTSGGGVDLDLAWRSVGKAGREISLKLLQGGQTVMVRRLPVQGGHGTPGPASSGTSHGHADIRKTRVSWNPDRSMIEGREPLRAVLEPGDAAADFDKYNDTLAASFPQGRFERVIRVFRPIRSLDEKGMLGILQAWEGTHVSFFGREDLTRMAPAPVDQVWVEAAALGREGGLLAWLQTIPSKLVIYSRSGSAHSLQFTGVADAAWHAFTPAAEVKSGRDATAFPGEVGRLKSLSSEGTDLPDAPGRAYVEAEEGGKRGMLMGRVALGRGKRAFFFALPAIWSALFDSQGDFAVRENISAYIKAAHGLADGEDGNVKVTRPLRIWQEVPFDLEARVPGSLAKAAPAIFSLSGPGGFFREWGPGAQNAERAAQTAEGVQEIRIKALSLARGFYRLRVRAGADTLWRDSLEAMPKAALELGRIGFDLEALEEAAARSGGAMLSLKARSAPPEVTAKLPSLPAAQIRMEKTASIHLYNTPIQAALILLLLALSWLLRKKWDID